MSETITTTISSGRLAGIRENGIDRYRGVPYAAAPLGENRFRLPQPVAPWDGTRDAVELGPTAPQNGYSAATSRVLANVIIRGDEFLNLNIWSPAEAKKAPVMVWIHGGSLVNGSNALDGYDGSAFARDGIVFVGVNYRLGPEGFSVLDDAPLNLGLQDVAAALRWVRREIAAFGGDPASVTVFGESAGAVLISDLIASPDAKSLFDRAVSESGMLSAVPPATGGRATRGIAKLLGISTTRAAFAAKTPDELLAADAKVRAGATPLNTKPGYAPVIGDDLVPRAPADAAVDGAGDDIPVLIGWTAEEHRLFLLGQKPISALLFALVRARFRIGAKTLAAYRSARPDATRTDLFGQLAIDLVARVPWYRVADARHRRAAATWVYEFAWKSPVLNLGAAHAMEIGFVFDQLSSPDWVKLGGPNPPQALATQMHDAWVRFAKTGDPGWPAWNDNHPVMIFDTESSVVNGPHDAELSSLPRPK